MTLIERLNEFAIELADKFNEVIASIGNKQDTLVSGTNIKTVNGNSLVGSGDVAISGSGSALLYTASQGLTTLQKYYARDNAGVPIQVAKVLAPNGTDTGAMKSGDVIGGYTLQLNDLVFCQSSLSEDSGCFLVGSTTSTLVYQNALVQIQIGLSGGKIFTLKPAIGYVELVNGDSSVLYTPSQGLSDSEKIGARGNLGFLDTLRDPLYFSPTNASPNYAYSSGGEPNSYMKVLNVNNLSLTADATGTIGIKTDGWFMIRYSPVLAWKYTASNLGFQLVNSGDWVLYFDGKLIDSNINIPKINAVEVIESSSKRFVTDAQIATWDGGGSDPWTYIKLASEFTTTVIPVSDIDGLAFTPAANTTYEFEAQILVRSSSTATGARVGLAWNTGNTDGAAMITSPNSGNGFATSIGGTNASLLAAATGMPTNTNSALATIKGTIIVGASPSGNLKIQLASEVAASWVSARVGSFLKYRVLP